jgi:hypothetical protein
MMQMWAEYFDKITVGADVIRLHVYPAPGAGFAITPNMARRARNRLSTLT